MMTILGVKMLNELSRIPSYADEGASGFDLASTVELEIMPGEYKAVATGLAFEIPSGYEIQARGRSGLAFKNGVLAHFGTIDESYKGEVKVLLYNFGTKPLTVKVGDRIAQGVLVPVVKAIFSLTDELSVSNRGAGGFGSTGR